MATLKAELREILTKYGIDPRDKSKLWDCHGTLVLYHRAYEIIAARERITFDQPVIIEANSTNKIVALLVTGRMGERAEWSIGEAAPGNCKNAYVYAIAEKRAKDRVIAKLVGLAEHVYSEDEADEFKDAPRQAVAAATTARDMQTEANRQISNGHLPPNPEEPPEVGEERARIKRLIDYLGADIKNAQNSIALDLMWGSDEAKKTLAIIEAAGPKGKAAGYELRSRYMARSDQLKDAEATA